LYRVPHPRFNFDRSYFDDKILIIPGVGKKGI